MQRLWVLSAPGMAHSSWEPERAKPSANGTGVGGLVWSQRASLICSNGVKGLSFSARLNFHPQHLCNSTHQAALVSPSRGESQGSLSWGPALPPSCQCWNLSYHLQEGLLLLCCAACDSVSKRNT